MKSCANRLIYAIVVTSIRLTFINPIAMQRLSIKLVLLSLFILLAVLRPAELARETIPSSPAVVPTATEGTAVVIAAIGDIMMPASIQKAATGNNHNYEFLFEKIAADLVADITFANLETPVDDRSPQSGYPKFNARKELLTALKKAGIGIVSVANNHALDAGPAGLQRTLDNIEAAGIAFAGAGRTRDEAKRARLVSARGITVAFLAYTYGTNAGMPRRKRMPVVNILRPGSAQDLALVAASVRKSRASADIVVVSLHWGDEYRSDPTPWQRQAAAALIEAGADIILGHHPHVLQPVESHAARDGRVGLVAFSLGNFISSQNSGISSKNKNDTRALRGDGVVLLVHVRKEEDKTFVSRAEFLPIWTLHERAGGIVIPRPVSLAREIMRIKAASPRSAEEENALALLLHRQKIITDRMTTAEP
jgi:poly-gamma-glutamate synthesis protein (capsule biosynthesis protein)